MSIWRSKKGKNPIEKIKSSGKTKKFNNEITLTCDGKKADSKLEARFYDLLKRYKVDFNFQHNFLLQEPFKDTHGKAIKKIGFTVDFFIPNYKGKALIIDTKGVGTEPTILRCKMLEKQLQDREIDYNLVFLTSNSAVDSCAIRLKKGMEIGAIYNNKKIY